MKKPYEYREGGGTCLGVEKKVKFAFNNVGKIFSLSEPGHIYIIERFGGIKDSCGRNSELRNAEVQNSTAERFDRFWTLENEVGKCDEKILEITEEMVNF